MTCHYPIPSCSAEHEPRERKDRADISGISHSAFACFMLRGFTRLMLDCHLVLLIRSLFQEHLKYPVDPHPQNPLERISMGTILSTMPWLYYCQR